MSGKMKDDSMLVLEALLEFKRSPSIRPLPKPSEPSPLHGPRNESTIHGSNASLSSLKSLNATIPNASRDEKKANSMDTNHPPKVAVNLQPTIQSFAPQSNLFIHTNDLPTQFKLTASPGHISAPRERTQEHIATASMHCVVNPSVKPIALPPPAQFISANMITNSVLYSQNKTIQHNSILPKPFTTSLPSIATTMWTTPTPQSTHAAENLPKITGLVPNPLLPSLSPTAINSNNTSNVECTSKVVELSSIRTSEVQAALLSKPQRGRKRENLNVLERLELTRTRNREHAKSTRIRKKARYQELLEKEQKYEEFMDDEMLRQARNECLLNFMKLRSRELVNLSWPSQLLHFEKQEKTNCNSSSNSPPTSGLQMDSMTKDEIVQSRDRANSHFSSASSDQISLCTDIDSLPFHQALHCVLEDPNNFQFTLHCPLQLHQNSSSNTGLEKLRDHDYAVREYVVKQFGATIARTIRFSISGDPLSDVVALTSNIGFAQYNIHVASETTTGSETVPFTGVTRVMFAQGSSKLASMELWFNASNIDNPQRTVRSPDDLKISSFPSVVSLENPQGFDQNEGAQPSSFTRIHGRRYVQKEGKSISQMHQENVHNGFDMDLGQCSAAKKS